MAAFKCSKCGSVMLNGVCAEDCIGGSPVSVIFDNAFQTLRIQAGDLDEDILRGIATAIDVAIDKHHSMTRTM